MNIKRKAVFLSVVLSAFLTSAVAMTAAAADGTGGRSPADASIAVITPEDRENEKGAETLKHTDALSHAMEILKRKNKLKKTSYSGVVTFERADFSEYADGEEVNSVTVLSLPEISEGTLKLGALDVFKGQRIAANSINRLKFIPAYSGAEASFTFSVNEAGDECDCEVFALSTENAAPAAESKTVYTKQNVKINCFFDVTDPDGDDVVCSVISQPSHGLLSVNGTNFTYTPKPNHIGSDNFVCAFEDKYGNKSEPVTVKVKTERSKCGFVYSDMKDNKAEYAAYLLAERDILKGQTVADTVSFEPDKTVTRADFIVMAMKAAGYSPNVYTPLRDGFEGVESLSETQRGYVVTAVSANVIDIDNVADPAGAITKSEAQAIISALDSNYKPASSDGAKALTRADAAVMLAALIDGRR